MEGIRYSQLILAQCAVGPVVATPVKFRMSFGGTQTVFEASPGSLSVRRANPQRKQTPLPCLARYLQPSAEDSVRLFWRVLSESVQVRYFRR